MYIQGNKDRLLQVLVNLISNAIKFVPPNKGKIKIALLEKNDQALIKVKDNGIGISEKDQITIFDRFTQISNAKLGKPQGSGLGLFISKKIIEQHRGTITIKSKEGKGTTFTIKLPI